MPHPVQTHPRLPLTLAERLNGVVSTIRGQVEGRIGKNPYDVFKVIRSWPGGQVGRGKPTDTRMELRCGPDAQGRASSPKVILDGNYRHAPQGVVEDGTAYVDNLDPTYIEAQLVPYGRLLPGEESFVEIIHDGRDGGPPDRPARRFTIEGLPFFDSSRFCWVLKLRSQEPSASFAQAQLSASGDVP